MDLMSEPTRRVLLAKPRGYCAGVDRAVQTVELALERFGAPVYVRKQIVHNTHVVRTLEERGAIFVEETDEVPEGAVVVFSAHGVAPQVRTRPPGPQPAHHRRDLPAGHQGAQRGQAVRRPGLRHPADRPRGPRGGRRHHRRGAGQHPPGGRPGGQRRRRGPRPGQGRLAVPDHAVGRRDQPDGRRAARAVPAAARPAERRHLLRHPEPAGRGQADRRASPTSSSSSARGTPPTRFAWSRWPWTPARPPPTWSTTPPIDPAWLDGVTTVGVTSGASVPEDLVVRRARPARRGRLRRRSKRSRRSARAWSSRCRTSCARRRRRQLRPAAEPQLTASPRWPRDGPSSALRARRADGAARSSACGRRIRRRAARPAARGRTAAARGTAR